MQVLINGKSRFGLVGAVGRQPLPVRTIVIDDAHAALALAEERTFLRIPSSHPAHAALLDMFDDDLRQQGLNALLDIREGHPTATPLGVPFWSWYNKREQVLQILRPHRADGVFEWSWPLIADILPWCQATVGTETIEITPLCSPIEKLPSFAEADRRIYLTATLADDSVLVTHFGADANSVAASIVPDSAADLGDRLIIALRSSTRPSPTLRLRSRPAPGTRHVCGLGLHEEEERSLVLHRLEHDEPAQPEQHLSGRLCRHQGPPFSRDPTARMARSLAASRVPVAHRGTGHGPHFIAKSPTRAAGTRRYGDRCAGYRRALLLRRRGTAASRVPGER